MMDGWMNGRMGEQTDKIIPPHENPLLRMVQVGPISFEQSRPQKLTKLCVT